MSDVAYAYYAIFTDLIPQIVIQVLLASWLVGLFTRNLRKI